MSTQISRKTATDVSKKTVRKVVTGLCLGVATIAFAAVGGVSTAHAVPIKLQEGQKRFGPITSPAALNPGDQYRLAFVTSNLRIGSSSDINDYNGFVTAAANSQAALVALGTAWKAILSTPTVDARDNTGTNPASATGVPIYLLDGISRVANDNADLWDGSIGHAINVREKGIEVIKPELLLHVWTSFLPPGPCPPPPKKCGPEGDRFPPIIGDPMAADGTWIDYSISHSPTTDLNYVYGLSGILTVAAIPEPGTLTLYAAGLAVCAVARRRTRNTRRS